MSSGWNVTGSCASVLPVSPTGPCGALLDSDAESYSGSYEAAFGGNPDTLSQTLTTVPGGTYTLNFWVDVLSAGGVATPNSFTVLWGGDPVDVLTNLPASGYVDYSVTNLVALGASTVLEFETTDDATALELDDVNVSSVPEPSGAAMVGIGVLVLFGVGRLRVRASSLASKPRQSWPVTI